MVIKFTPLQKIFLKYPQVATPRCSSLYCANPFETMDLCTETAMGAALPHASSLEATQTLTDLFSPLGSPLLRARKASQMDCRELCAPIVNRIC